MNTSVQYLKLRKYHWHECLENSYDFLRASWPGNWPGMPFLLLECLRFLDIKNNSLSAVGRSFLGAAQSVAIDIENQALSMQNFKEPEFHNRLHFADALTSMSIQLAILVQLEKKENQDWMLCALLTCIAHDFAHSGKVNLVETEIEIQSVSFLKPILIAHSVPDEWQKVIETAIIRSDFSIVHHNHANVFGLPFQWDLKWLCVLLNEADVMASASAKYGPDLGKSLALEWQAIDFPNHSTVASLEGRKTFLKQLIFSSPSSIVLGIKDKIVDEIRLMC